MTARTGTWKSGRILVVGTGRVSVEPDVVVAEDASTPIEAGSPEIAVSVMVTFRTR